MGLISIQSTERSNAGFQNVNTSVWSAVPVSIPANFSLAPSFPTRRGRNLCARHRGGGCGRWRAFMRRIKRSPSPYHVRNVNNARGATDSKGVCLNLERLHILCCSVPFFLQKNIFTFYLFFEHFVNAPDRKCSLFWQGAWYILAVLAPIMSTLLASFSFLCVFLAKANLFVTC